MPGEQTILHPEYDLSIPEAHLNPFPVYRRLQSGDPVYWDPSFNHWLITRYDDVAAAFRDRRLSSNWIEPYRDRLPWLAKMAMAPLFRTVEMIVLFKDGDEHTRLRGLMNKAFTPRMVQGMKPHIQSIVDSLIAMFPQDGQIDLVRDLAYPLPTIVIAEVLGARPEDRAMFKKCSDDFALLFATDHPRADRAIVAQLSMNKMIAYFRNLIADRRQNPKEDDLLSGLVSARERGDVLSDDELAANLVNLLFAGHETTINLIGSGMLALMRAPDQMQKLREHPDLITTAVEEMLRYDGPVQMLRRLAAEDLEIGGKQIKKGQLVMLVVGAANHDPNHYPDPDTFDIARKENKHLTFGLSSHFCLGAPLARLEAQTAISTLLRRFPSIKLADNAVLEYNDTIGLRGLKSLPVTVA